MQNKSNQGCQTLCIGLSSSELKCGQHWSKSLLQLRSKWTEAKLTSKWYNDKRDTFLIILKQDYKITFLLKN